MNIFYVIIGVLGLGTFILSLINLIKCIKNLKKVTKNQFTITTPISPIYATFIHRSVIKTYKDALEMYIINIILSFIPIGLLVSHVIGLI